MLPAPASLDRGHSLFGHLTLFIVPGPCGLWNGLLGIECQMILCSELRSSYQQSMAEAPGRPGWAMSSMRPSPGWCRRYCNPYLRTWNLGGHRPEKEVVGRIDRFDYQRSHHGHAEDSGRSERAKKERRDDVEYLTRCRGGAKSSDQSGPTRVDKLSPVLKTVQHVQ